VATFCLVFRDDLATKVLREQTAMQYAYEERVAALRARLDRVASQKLIEQDGVEGRVSDLLARQAQLENRQAILSTLAEQAPVATGSLRGREPVPAPAPEAPRSFDAYAPLPEKPTPDFLMPGSRGGSAPAARQRKADASLDHRLVEVERSFARMETAQIQVLDDLRRAARDEAAKLRRAVTEAGLDPDKLSDPKPSTGGPLIPVDGATGGPFEALAGQVQTGFVALERLRRTSRSLPFGRPLPGEIDLTSGFGYRTDPFTRGPALHSGLDFRGEYGAPVRATAPGKVIAAEYSGGYGNMVELDHGNGITTRYAHLSSFAVVPGQTVAPGTVLGRVGSTGRSTGPHLHYETRIDGEAVDPQRFLRAGAKLADVKLAEAR
jgi:murein DD-endopeptidase MepM/ murein hydrolase activator NlpD